jgi:hypothetical protein
MENLDSRRRDFLRFGGYAIGAVAIPALPLAAAAQETAPQPTFDVRR